MAAVTQIVPQFSFPYVDTYITDYTEAEETETSTAVADPAISYIYAFCGDKGVDNRWILKRSQESFVKTFGYPNFKKYGQPALTPYNLLAGGGTKVWCMRVMPENATRAHAITSLYYKADSAKEIAVASKRKFRIKYTCKYVDPTSDTPIISKADLQSARSKTDGDTVSGIYKDGEGYIQAPGAIVLSSNGRGKGGNNFSVRIANALHYEKEYGIKIMGFEVLSTDRGLIKEAEYTGSLVTSVKYDTATLINDILEDTADGVAPVDIDVDEDQIETVYHAYISFCKSQYTDLQEELETKMTTNKITQAMLDGTEEIPKEKIAVARECNEIRAMIISCEESNLPSLDGFDPIFGLKLGSVTETQPFIYFPQKLTEDIDTKADDYVAADYTQTDIVSFDNIRGIVLKGGSDGYFETPRTETIINKDGGEEQIKWTLEEEVNDMYKKAWNGTLDKRILTAKRIDANALFDANYPYPVKCEMAKLTLARNDSIFYMDTNLRDTLGFNELKSMVDMYSIFNNRLFSKNIHYYYTKDPITKKRIPVTITYFLAEEYWKHLTNNGMHIPFVKADCQLSGHIRNSLHPTVEDYELELKEVLNENRFNYFETVEDNVYQRATQNTSQDNDSDLLEESNVTILYEAKRIIEKDINERTYRFNEASERSAFRRYELDKFRNWESNYVESIDITFKANKWELERSILHCYVSIVYRGIYKRAIVEIDINKRNYTEATDATDTSLTGIAE